MKPFFKIFFYFFIIILIPSVNSIAQNNPNNFIHTAQFTDNILSPIRMALDDNDNLYITDNKQNCIVKYDVSGNFIKKIALDFTPVSVASDKTGCLFIGAENSGNIFKREINGTISLFYGGCGFPSSLKVSSDNLLYVVDSEFQNVSVLDMSANLIKTIGSGILIYPTSIAYDGRNERILIGEHGGIGDGFTPVCTVWVFDLQGNLLDNFGSYGSQDGELYRIQGISVGKCGNYYVCDDYQGTISVFDENYNFLTKFGKYGNNIGELNVPLDIAFDSDEKILISSINNGTIEIYNVTDTFPTSNISHSDAVICSDETADILIKFTGTPPWDFTYTINGLNPENISTDKNPYILKVAEPGIYEIIELSDAEYSGTCFTGSAAIEVLKKAVPEFEFSVNNKQVNFFNLSENADLYLWDFGDGTRSEEVNPVHIYHSGGLYTVSLTAENKNCGKNTFSKLININTATLKNIDSGNFFKIYPNPADGIFTLEIENPEENNFSVEIVSVTGKIEYFYSFKTAHILKQINIENLPKGIYTVRLKSDKFIKSSKLILN